MHIHGHVLRCFVVYLFRPSYLYICCYCHIGTLLFWITDRMLFSLQRLEEELVLVRNKYFVVMISSDRVVLLVVVEDKSTSSPSPVLAPSWQVRFFLLLVPMRVTEPTMYSLLKCSAMQLLLGGGKKCYLVATCTAYSDSAR